MREKYFLVTFLSTAFSIATFVLKMMLEEQVGHHFTTAAMYLSFQPILAPLYASNRA